MRIARSIESVMLSFERLPGIGGKTAARLAYHLLHGPQSELDKFAEALSNLKRGTQKCALCQNIAESDPCDVCSSVDRDAGTIMVVEQPLDVIALERAGTWKGVYHVLYGSLNPMQGIGPDELTVGELITRVSRGPISEVVIATNSTLNGEATAMYLLREFRALQEKSGTSFSVTRLAKGIPMGGEVEYADEMTLRRALEGRISL